MPEPCPICGEHHAPTPLMVVRNKKKDGVKREQVTVQMCPRLPEGFVYMDNEYKHGPRGAVYRVQNGRLV